VLDEGVPHVPHPGCWHTDQPPLSLLTGLPSLAWSHRKSILKHTYDLSDEALCDRWVALEFFTDDGMIGREGIARTRAARGCRRIRSHGRSARQRTMCSLVTAVLVVYPLISPCREAQYLRRTLDSVAAQSVPPALWVVVDDGSTDETPAILEEYARRLPYLRVIRRTDRGGRQVGPGVIEALLRRPGEGVPGGLRLPVQALHGPRSAGPLLRAADAANGELSASRDDLRQAVVRTPATRRAGAGGLRG